MVNKKSNIKKLQPAPGYLLIEPEQLEQKTDSGIYLPDNASTDKPQKGKVIAVGDDEMMDNGKIRKSPAKLNDLVVFKKWGGSEYKDGTKEYLFSKFEDILAVEKK